MSDREILHTVNNAWILSVVTSFGILAGLGAVSTEAILGGSIGSAALIAAPRIFGTDQRDFTYMAGAEAMTCVLDGARQALLLSSETGFLTDVEDKRKDVLNSVRELARFNADLLDEAVTAIGRNVQTTLAEAQAIYLK